MAARECRGKEFTWFKEMDTFREEQGVVEGLVKHFDVRKQGRLVTWRLTLGLNEGLPAGFQQLGGVTSGVGAEPGREHASDEGKAGADRTINWLRGCDRRNEWKHSWRSVCSYVCGRQCMHTNTRRAIAVVMIFFSSKNNVYDK